MASSSYSNPPCAACKFLRRKCLPDCIFAPYFPPEEPHKFANVHKIFGASNVSKLLNEVHPSLREDAVSSLAYEAEARMKDPVYGCAGAISVLQGQVIRLQRELDATNADLVRFACSEIPNRNNPTSFGNLSDSGSSRYADNAPFDQHQVCGGGYYNFPPPWPGAPGGDDNNQGGDHEDGGGAM